MSHHLSLLGRFLHAKLDTLSTEDGKVEVEFHDQNYVSDMAIAAWIGSGFGDSIDTILDVPAVETDFGAVEAVLYEQSFDEFYQSVEDNYL